MIEKKYSQAKAAIDREDADHRHFQAWIKPKAERLKQALLNRIRQVMRRNK